MNSQSVIYSSQYQSFVPDMFSDSDKKSSNLNPDVLWTLDNILISFMQQVQIVSAFAKKMFT